MIPTIDTDEFFAVYRALGRILTGIDEAGIPTTGLTSLRFAHDSIACEYVDDEFTADIRFQGTATHHEDGTITTSYRLSALRGRDHWRKALATPGDSLVGQDSCVEARAAEREEHLAGAARAQVADPDDVAGADPAIGLVADGQAVHAVSVVDVHEDHGLPARGTVRLDRRGEVAS